jgi:hypothetical protein
MEKLTKLEDRLYGKGRISNLKKLKKEYSGYIDLLRKEVKLAKAHASIQRNKTEDENGNTTVRGYANKTGISLQYDKQGNIENGREIEKALLDKVNAATADYNQHRNEEDTSAYEDAMNDAQKDYDGFMKALSDYTGTLGKIEEGKSQIQEYKEKIQDAADGIVDAIQSGIDDMIEAIDSQRDFDRMYRE